MLRILIYDFLWRGIPNTQFLSLLAGNEFRVGSIVGESDCSV